MFWNWNKQTPQNSPSHWRRISNFAHAQWFFISLARARAGVVSLVIDQLLAPPPHASTLHLWINCSLFSSSRNDTTVSSVIVNRGNGYETRQTSEGLTKEQTLMLVRVSALHNLLFYAHSLCLTDQTQTFSLAHCPIYAGMFLFFAESRLKKVNKKIEQWVS